MEKSYIVYIKTLVPLYPVFLHEMPIIYDFIS